VVHPLWLKELIPSLKEETNGAVGGKVDSWFDKSALDRYEKVSSSLNKGDRYKSSREEGSFFYLAACNLLVRKSLFSELNGFNEDMSVGEDVDLCWRIKNRGFEIEYIPKGVIFHRHRSRIRAFFIRRFQYGTSEPLLNKKHTDRVKKMFYNPLSILFWLFIVISLMTGCYFLLAGAPLILLTDSAVEQIKVKKKDLPIEYLSVFNAVFRGYFVSIYYWCEFLSRYYLVFSIVLLFFIPLLSLFLIMIHIAVSLSEYLRKRPDLNFFSFLYSFTVDQLAYQLGVWFGCFKYFSFNPVNPVIEAL
jgi:cellulose synthase/poly-beta-1,6-N-acetylglucosamine synthase-like glycosyltransferase